MSEIIVAMDVSTNDAFENLLNQFTEPVYVKIGKETVYSLGFDVIKKIKERGHKVFLDLKLHDIPNTVYHAMKALAKLEVDMVNVHASGGIDMMKAAVKGVKEINPQIKCIAVTLLTSLDEDAVSQELKLDGTLSEMVDHYAVQAKLAGMDGVVCSVHEAKRIHQLCGNQFCCVTPGIVYATNVSPDQKRIATPTYAVQQGVDYLVIGRSITKSESPYDTYLEIEGEVNHASTNC